MCRFYRSTCLDGERVAQVKEVLEKAAEKFGRVDGVVDCAGSALIKPAHLTSAEEFHDAIALNVLSAFNILKGAVSNCFHIPNGFFWVLSIHGIMHIAHALQCYSISRAACVHVI